MFPYNVRIVFDLEVIVVSKLLLGINVCLNFFNIVTFFLARAFNKVLKIFLQINEKKTPESHILTKSFGKHF